MQKKIYLAALILGFGCLGFNASAEENSLISKDTLQYEERIEEFKTLIKEDWHNTKAHNDLGEVYLKLMQLDRAKEEFKTALETDRVYSMGPFLFGDIKTDAERYQSKIYDFKEVIKQNHEFARSHHNLGSVRLAQKRYDLAKKQYEEALRINPKYAQAYNGLGVVYEELGQLDQAIEEYKTALFLDENNAVVNYNIGLAYNKKDDRKKSVFYLTKARELYKKKENVSKGKYLENLVAHLERTYVEPKSEIQTVAAVSEELNQVAEVIPDKEPTAENHSPGSSVTPDENMSVENKGMSDFHIEETSTEVVTAKTEIDSKTDEETNASPSITDETVTEDGQKVKVLKVKTSNGEFLGNSRTSSSVIPETTKSDIILTTSSSDSVEENQVVAKKIIKKEPEHKGDDPFLGDWLFEYPK